ALEGGARARVEVDADDAQVDLDPLLPEALGDLAQVAAARLHAVGDQHDQLAALGREVPRGQLERVRDRRGAERVGRAHGLEQRLAGQAAHGHDEVRVLAGAGVGRPDVRAVHAQAHVEALLLRQGGDELRAHLLGRHDAVAAVLELVPHRAGRVEDQLEVRGLLRLRERAGQQQADGDDGRSQVAKQTFGHFTPTWTRAGARPRRWVAGLHAAGDGRDVRSPTRREAGPSGRLELAVLPPPLDVVAHPLAVLPVPALRLGLDPQAGDRRRPAVVAEGDEAE